MAFDQAKADEICSQIAERAVSLDAILSAPGMPKKTQVYGWLRDNPSFAENYTRARESQADTDADEIANIRQRVVDGDLTPEQGRVAIDSLKWSAGKRSPKKYGDKVQHDVDGKLEITLVDATKRED